jgi:hypothetical protein
LRSPNGATAVIVEAGDFVDQILRDSVRPAPVNFEMPVEWMQQPQMSAPHPIEDNPASQEPDAVDDRVKTMADLLGEKPKQSRALGHEEQGAG